MQYNYVINGTRRLAVCVLNNGRRTADAKYGYHGLSGRRTDMSLLFTSESMVRETSDSPFFPGVPPSDISP